MHKKLNSIYRKLFYHFGPQHWWPGESAFEVMVGAILTQNTNWSNVEKAINNLKTRKVLTLSGLTNLPKLKLAKLIRPAGYYNIKAGRLKELVKFLSGNYSGDINKMSIRGTVSLREELLAVKGVGPETADSILLYALNKPVFVIDAYTKRIFSRHGFIKEDATYDEAQSLFTRNLKKNTRLFNEYHALIVKLGKEFCLKSKPKCAICPLSSFKYGCRFS